MAIFVQNFNTVQQQPLSVTASSAAATFTGAEALAATDIMVVNYGSKGCQLNVGAIAVATTSAAGTRQTYIPAGAVMIIGKGTQAVVSAICDGTDTTSLAIHAGRGA